MKLKNICGVSFISFMNLEKLKKVINRPLFCPCKSPETGKRCKKIMTDVDDNCFEWYGMCEECYLKYNSHKEEIAEEMEKQQKQFNK